MERDPKTLLKEKRNSFQGLLLYCRLQKTINLARYNIFSLKSNISFNPVFL